MRKKNRSFLLMSLISAALLVSGFPIAQAQNSGAPAAKRWSDPATWPEKKVPAKDALVTITKDMNVVMDEHGGFIEIQGTAEKMAFHKNHLDNMLGLADEGIKILIQKQREAVK